MIHPTALVDPLARVDATADIGPFCVVEAQVDIGPRCKLLGHVTLRAGTVLEEDVAVHAQAVLGGEPQDLRFDPATPSGVRVGAGSVLREGVTIHRATVAGTSTSCGPRCYLMANAHLGHDARVDEDTILANGVLVAGHVHIGPRVFVGGGAAFHQFLRIGEGAMIGGTARLTRDVAPFTLASERDELHGLNLVGLRRRGFTRPEIAELKTLFHAVFQPGNPREHAAALRAETAPGARFLAFFAASKRGFIRPGAPPDAEPA